MFGLGVPEMVVLGTIAVILFGKKLPDVAKSLGKSVVEFKKGVHGLEDGVNDVVAAPAAAPAEPIRAPQRVATTAPKFEEAAQV